MNIQPLPNENAEQFAIRAHQAILANPNAEEGLKDYETRNQYVWQCWEAAYEQNAWPAKNKLRAKLKPETGKYVESTDHCHFMEHERPGADGTMKRYTANDLAEICQHTNNRAIKTDKFTALSKDHTPLDPNGPDPENMGWTGNFRIGMVNNEQFGVWGDEYYRHNFAQHCEGMPQRSVELITKRDSGERFFDPIAMLSTKTPRLALPVKYGMSYDGENEESGVLVERYSMESPVETIETERNMMGAAAYPGGSNTQFGGCQQYGGNSAEQSMEMANLVSQLPILQQLEEILPALVQMVQKQTVEEFPSVQAGADPAPQPQPGMPPQAEPVPAPQDPAQAPAIEQNNMGAMPQPSMPPMGPAPQMEQNNYSIEDEMSEFSVERFSALESENADLKAQLADQQSQLNVMIERFAESEANAEIERQNLVKEKRLEKIQSLTDRYGGQLFDHESTVHRFCEDLAPESEYEAFVEQTERFAEILENTAAQRIPTGKMPAPVIPGKVDEAQVERYAMSMANDFINEHNKQCTMQQLNEFREEARQKLSGK